MTARTLAIALSVLALVASPRNAARAAEAPIDFNRDIRPILAGNCFMCHGPDDAERKAGLRLDTRDGAVHDHDGMRAVVPGDPDASELLRRVTAADADRMPPAKSGKRLKPAEVELLRRWIEQDAPYATHWSYVKPVRPPLPEVRDASWPANPIDYFILARLEREGLSPSPRADRYALIRRVSLDLTGLPPTLEEVEAFVNDDSDRAYEKLVDRLLAKKSYGEHWARMWLDLARYADSAGYADDPPRTIWAYRDYVIRSFNENKPFDRFTIEQIAGDLVEKGQGERDKGQGAEQSAAAQPLDPSPLSLDPLIATAFHRNTQTNNEGGTSDEEFRNVAIVDRVNTTLATWMGTTIACAQCHTHKYDPITQEEFFQVFALFNSTADADRRDESPLVEIWTDEQRQQKAELRDLVAALKQQVQDLEASSEGMAAAMKSWEEKLLADAGAAVSGRYVRVEIVDRAEFLSLAEVQVFRGGENIAPKGKAEQSSTEFGGPPERAIDGNTSGDYHGASSTTHTANEKNPWWQVDLGEAAGPIERIAVWNRTDGGVGSRLNGWRVSVLDENKQTVWQQDVKEPPTPSREIAMAGAPADVWAIVRTPPLMRSDDQHKRLNDYYRPLWPELKAKRDEAAAAEKRLANLRPLTTVPVMRDLPADKRRQTHVQIRGNYLQTGEEVSPGVPDVFHDLPVPEGAQPDRLALAKWLVDEGNPLTARVVVNRYWEKLFGVGIVATSEEFGSQGELPTHPQLLDWLATELMRSGWDLKHLLKLMVTSAAYRQSSRVTPELIARDPDNRLLARGPRFRVSAEVVRDQALFVSGLLSTKMFGPPVRPPQPAFGLSAAFGPGMDWQTSEGEDRYRRGIYTQWRRSNPYPSMAAFDAPNREVCIIRRDRTNTPLQALVTLNDPVYIEAAQALARRMVREGGATPAEQARYGFRLCLSRPPTEEELSRLVQLYDAARATFAADPAKATQMATNPLGPAPEGMDVAELAAWTVVGNVLLNLDEMFMSR